MICMEMVETMALFTWWRGDPLLSLRELNGFHAAASDDMQLLAPLTGLKVTEVQRRLLSRHRPYTASLGRMPVAYGWVALEGADIGELDVQFTLSQGDRYLWDFKTLPKWRGRGIYPRLLQAVLRAESRDAERFWIIHAPENGASQAGIEKAGFLVAGELSFRRNEGAGLVPGDLPDRARAGAALLGVPLVKEAMLLTAHEDPLAPCWHCVINARQSKAGDTAVDCWAPSPPVVAARPPCTCGCG